MAGPRRPRSRRPSPTPRSPQRSSHEGSLSQSSQAGSPPTLETTMKNLMDKARAHAAANAATPSAPPPPPTLQDLISQSNRTTQFRQTVFTNPVTNHQYKAQTIIGSSTSGRATVYRGVYCVNDAYELERMEHYEIYVAVKVTDMDDHVEHGMLVDQIYRSRQLLDHPNVLMMKEEVVLENTHCLVFLLMDGSLRCLLKSCFTNGIPEHLIAIVLGRVLAALANLHQQGHLHQELNAGHIYYKASIPAIKIGFLSTIYEHNSGDDGQALAGNQLPVSEICEWAAAPEIYRLGGEYTAKSDVWLVGITALELAFGEIQVEDREGLERLIAKAKSGKGIAKAKLKAAGRYIKKLVIKKLKIGTSGTSSSSKKEKVIFSRAFRRLLASCLAEDAGKRPTAAELLQHDFFKKYGGDIYIFMEAVRQAREAREARAVASGSNVAGPSGSNIAGPSGSNVAGPSGSNVAGPSGSNVAGPSGSNAAGPSGSNVAGPSTRSSAAAPSSGRSGAASSTGSNVAGPSTRSTAAAPSSGRNVAGSSTGSNVAGSSTGSDVAGPSTQSNVAAPSTGSNVAGPSTGSNVAGPSTS